MSLPSTDHDLLSRAAAGERQAFEGLVGRHQGLVRAACLRQAPAAEADDCVQAVFLVLMRKPAQAAKACSLEAWLLTVVRHVCARARRAQANRRRAELEAAMISTSSTDSSTAAVNEHLDACLESLPVRQRAVITMHFLAGRSRDEIAGALGIGVDAVHQHCHRGLERLRELLRRRGVAVPAAGLLAVLAREGKIAGMVAPAAILPAVAGGMAANYAAGAVLAMTTAVFVPAGLAAAVLVTVVGTGFVLASAGPSPPLPASPSVVHAAPASALVPALIPISAPRPHVAPDSHGARTELAQRGSGRIAPAAASGATEPAWLQAARDRLRQKLTADIHATEAKDVVYFMSQVTGVNVVVDPQLEILLSAKKVTLRVTEYPAAAVLDEICEQFDAHWDLRDQAVYISGGVAPSPVGGG